jgi:glucan phosphoethanolaminetransferase (alkaline phosphatase superfamily)
MIICYNITNARLHRQKDILMLIFCFTAVSIMLALAGVRVVKGVALPLFCFFLSAIFGARVVFEFYKLLLQR